MDMKLHGSSKKQDWGTPTQWFNDLHKVFNFTIDACAQPHNAKLPRYWSPEQDGLKQDWFGERVWCNPPYGKELPPWPAKMVYERGNADLIMMLVFARTDTKWFQSLKNQGFYFCFLKGRMKFENEPEQEHPPFLSETWFKFRFHAKGFLTFSPGDSAPTPSMLVIAGRMSDFQIKYLDSLGVLMQEF